MFTIVLNNVTGCTFYTDGIAFAGIVASQVATGLGVSTTHSVTATATTCSSLAVSANYPMEVCFASTSSGGEVFVTNLFGETVGNRPGNISIYPNPTSGSFKLSLAAGQELADATIQGLDP